jgi:MFS family permease
MDKRQLAALFACNLCPMVIGNGVLPLLPTYAAQLGAPSTLIGLYLAFSYAAIAVGALSAARMGRALGDYRRALSISCALAVPATLAMGYVPNVWALTALTAALWFTGGVGTALVNVLGGLAAGAEERGRVFGTIALAAPVGTLLGGLAAGPLVERWGYRILFVVMAGVAALWLLVSRTVGPHPLQRGRMPAHASEHSAEAEADGTRLGVRFYLLFAARILSSVSSFVALLGRLLVMGQLDLSATVISMTGAVTGAITIPVSPLAGFLSDRVGRRLLIALGYVFGVVALLLLVVSRAPWHFWVAATVGGASTSLSSTVSSAFAVDVLPREALDRGMSLISAAGWIGAIAGFSGTGYAVEHLGAVTTFAGSAVLPLVAITLLYLIPVRAQAGRGALA